MFAKSFGIKLIQLSIDEGVAAAGWHNLYANSLHQHFAKFSSLRDVDAEPFTFC